MDHQLIFLPPVVAPLQLPPIPIAYRPFDPAQPIHDLGSLNIEDNQCPSCKALHWLDERLSGSSKRRPKFGMCCYKGKISLPSLHRPPPELYWLLTTEDPRGTAFCCYIRNYNSALAMTSVVLRSKGLKVRRARFVLRRK